MISFVPTILAADENDLLIKVGFFLLAGIIWAASQVVGWLNSKKDKTLPPGRSRQQQRTQGQPVQYRVPMEQPLRPPPLQRRQQQSPVLQRPPALKSPRKQKQTRPVPVPATAAPEPQKTRAQEKVHQAMTHAYDARPQRDDPLPVPADALPRRQVLDALLKPRNLRKAFIVTELLGPPVALRPPTPAPATSGQD